MRSEQKVKSPLSVTESVGHGPTRRQGPFAARFGNTADNEFDLMFLGAPVRAEGGAAQIGGAQGRRTPEPQGGYPRGGARVWLWRVWGLSLCLCLWRLGQAIPVPAISPRVCREKTSAIR